MPPSSLASLSKLSSLRSGGNQFFEPDYERDPAAVAGDVEEAQTGLNPTARQELAMRGLQDMQSEYDLKGDQRNDQRRRMDAAWNGPEGFARTSPTEAAHANEIDFGDARAAHDLTNSHNRIVSDAGAKAEGYWLPASQSMLENEVNRTERLNQSRYVDPVEARSVADLEKARIDAGARTGAAQITANGRSSDIASQGTASEIAQLLRRGDVNPSDPDSIAKALQGFLTLRNGAGASGGGVPVPGGAGGPDLSGLAPGHGRTFTEGPFAGQVWTTDASGKPSRVK